ncbi:hypothetical protein QSH57_004303 [Fusarium oxysporum f. sp. vasinfectum]|nr:hypothetical protein QSH57_004303 [Fusarium oxysporum f. sp. vasinfectum]
MFEPGTIIAVVEVCTKCVQYITEKIRNYRAADNEVAERIILVENCWTRTRIQVDFIQPLTPIIDPEHHRVLDSVLGILATKLSSAVASLEGVLEKKNKNGVELRPGFFGFARGVRKGEYAFVKTTLDTVIRDLEEWQRRFDPSWFLIMRMGSPLIDEQLRRGMTQSQASLQPHPDRAQSSSPRPLPPKAAASPSSSEIPQSRQPSQHCPLKFTLATRLHRIPSPFLSFSPPTQFEYMPLPYTNTKAARRGDRWYIVESRTCKPGMQEAMTNDIRDLAQKLSRADPLAFGLLNCKGVTRVTDPRHPSRIVSFDLIFRIPEGMEIPQSLRQSLILYPGRSHSALSVTRRVRIAQELAKSVSYVHTFKFVHKNINPESVLLLEDLESSRSATFLVGFDHFRSAGGATSLQGDGVWYRDLYRHPTRQGEYPEDSYHMQHDIYSLGVCLLEVGLWESFVDYSSDTPSPDGPIGDLAARIMPAGDAASSGNIAARTIIFEAKDYMEKLAKERLPQAMGENYSQVVLSCLTCLDENNEDFGGDAAQQAAADPDGILLGVQFNELILGRLNEIVV